MAVNWNTISTYEEVSGKSIGEWEALAAESAQGGKSIPAREVLYWAYASMKEGARIESKEFALTIDQVGAMLTPGNSSQFVVTFTRLYTGGQAEVNENQSKKK